ncbi:hypothetical protein HNQ91_000148 [Filimonas zeae]|nr:hypothetical protein [Filimonas zeae]
MLQNYSAPWPGNCTNHTFSDTFMTMRRHIFYRALPFSLNTFTFSTARLIPSTTGNTQFCKVRPQTIITIPRNYITLSGTCIITIRETGGCSVGISSNPLSFLPSCTNSKLSVFICPHAVHVKKQRGNSSHRMFAGFIIYGKLILKYIESIL